MVNGADASLAKKIWFARSSLDRAWLASVKRPGPPPGTACVYAGLLFGARTPGPSAERTAGP